MKPKISIILPTYNGETFLAEAIESCIHQTLRDWELIIVDDCSTDSTPVIIKQYAARDPRIRSIRHETNRKLPAALNTGSQSATGAYHTWISDDNLYRDNALQVMSDYLDRHPDIGIVYTDAEVVDEQGETLRMRIVDPPDRLIEKDCIGWSFMYRSEVFKKIGGYDEQYFMAEDYDFWLRAVRFYKAAALHKNVFVYRMHSRSLTGSRLADCRLASARMLLRNVPHIRWAPGREKALTYYEAASLFRRLGFAREAAKAWLMALAVCPLYTTGRMWRFLLRKRTSS